MARPDELATPDGSEVAPLEVATRASGRTWRFTFPLVTVLLPALVVFAAEVIRHEVLHGLVPEMLGNVLTGAAALSISALILLPIYRRLEAADARLRATEIEHAVSEERERLARELHDGISQALFFLNVKATSLEDSLAAPDVVTARHVTKEIAHAVRDTSRRVREAIFDLRTGPEPGQPFSAWVRDYAQRFGEIHGLSEQIEEVGTPAELPFGDALHAMAIVREALHNVAKHAQARELTIRIEWGMGDVTIQVSDDGQGVPDPIPGPAQGRYGLTALREHACATGGTMSVASGPSGGTVVRYRTPHSSKRSP